MGNNGALIGGVAGGLVGSYFGVPGMGFAVGSLVGGLISPGNSQKIKGPQLGDSQNQQSLYGSAVPLLYGTSRIAGNVIWGKDVEEFEKTSGGGKGGSPKEETTTYTYFWSGAICLCDNEIVGIKRIWVNDQLYTDLTSPNAHAPINIRVYTGTKTQRPEPVMEMVDGVGNVPAYRGKAYVFIERFQLHGSSTPPTFHFEVVQKGATDINGLILPDIVGQTGLGSRIEIDPLSGFVWITKTGAVNVYDCNGGLRLVKTIPKTYVGQISYQPEYAISLSVPLLGSSIFVVPAQMWVGAGGPDSLAETTVHGYRTDGSYAKHGEVLAPFSGSSFCWPGACLIDKSSISQIKLMQPGAVSGVIGTVNGLCTSAVVFDPSGLPPIISETMPQFSYVSEMIDTPTNEKKGIVYAVDAFGVLTQNQSAPPLISTAEEYPVVYWLIRRLVANTSSYDFNNSLAYDEIENRLYVLTSNKATNTKTLQLLTPSFEEVWRVEYPTSGDFYPTRVRYHKGTGDIWLGGIDSQFLSNRVGLVEIEKDDGSEIRRIRVQNQTIGMTDFILFPGAPLAIVVGATYTMKVPLVAGALSDPPMLSEVITDLALRSKKVTAEDIDVSDLTSIPVLGFIVGRRQSLGDCLTPLLENYFVDPVEADGKLKFVLRGKASTVTIFKEELSAHAFNSTIPSPIVAQRTQDNALPRSMDGRFVDVNNEYKISVVNAGRLTGESEQLRSHNIPIVFDVDVVKQIIDTLLFNAWADREPRDFVVSRKFLKITPTDVIKIEDPDLGIIEVRVNRVEYHFPQLMKIQATIEDITTYSGFTFPGENTETILPKYPTTSNSLPLLLDLPPLRDADNELGLYVAAYTVGGVYRPTELFSSPDFIEFTNKAILLKEATVASAPTPLTWTGSFK